jgi:hypothetical protein
MSGRCFSPLPLSCCIAVRPLACPSFSSVLILYTIRTGRTLRYLHAHNRTLRSLGILADDPGNGHARHLRIFAIASMDIALSLPVGLVSIILALSAGPPIVLWPGWAIIHDNWDPVFTPAFEWRQAAWPRFRVLWNEWVNIVLGLAIFALFGTAGEARQAYWEAGRMVWCWIGLVRLEEKEQEENGTSFLNMDGPPMQRPSRNINEEYVPYFPPYIKLIENFSHHRRTLKELNSTLVNTMRSSSQQTPRKSVS